MKILVLNYEYPPLGGGAATVSRELSKRLAEEGNEVSIVTMGYKGLPESDRLDGMDIYRVKCLRKKKSSCMPWEQLTYIISAKLFLKKHVELQNYDVCHTHFIMPTGVIALWLKKNYGIPYIITAHGSDVEDYNTKKYVKLIHILLRGYWRKIVKCSDKVISPSDYLLGLMNKRYSSVDKYKLIPNGIDYDEFKKIPQDKKHSILVMGRLQKSKNVHTVIEALEGINLADWRVNVLGDGPQREALEEMARNSYLSDKISFWGWVENGGDIQKTILSECSIYITASEFENCPMAVLEAIAAGCTPILSDIPAHRQMISNDEVFFSPHDKNMLKKILLRNMNENRENFDYSADLGKYSWEHVMQEYGKTFKERV